MPSTSSPVTCPVCPTPIDCKTCKPQQPPVSKTPESSKAPITSKAPSESTTKLSKPESTKTISTVSMLATSTESGLPQDNRYSRLPRNLLPTHYTLRLQPDMYGPNPSAFRFIGHVTIDLNCVEATDKIVLHARDLNVSCFSKTSEAFIEKH